MFKTTKSRASAKSEETAQTILDAALELFRQEGFESATMRKIAQRAGVATGAAYYYYESKDAIVMDFYRRASAEMQPTIDAAIARTSGLEAGLRELIRTKLEHFAPNRIVLRALLRNGADPRYPLSPFSQETRTIRDTDIASFDRLLRDSGIRIPSDLRQELPGILWFFQMGVILFWVIDDSPKQVRTQHLLDLSSKIVVTLIRASSLPLLRPVRRPILQLIEIVKGE